jgi:hypothetical protein
MAKPSFELGIVMAGAISAGAYSAGVMDFLIEALEAYYEAKDTPGWDGPKHDVRVPILAGASAGGMTAAIAALHAFHGMEHVWPDRPSPDKPANRLYSSWVTDISIEALLETSDLDNGKDKLGVKSALCCDVLDRIVRDAFVLKNAVRTPKWVGRDDDASLKVMVTLTNLRGVSYSFSIFGAGADDRYGMLNHGDYLAFRVGMGPSPEAGTYALDIRKTQGPEWDLFRTAALATGAFPIGLTALRISREPIDYEGAERVGYEDLTQGFRSIPPDDGIRKISPYSFVSVDGGVIDNEPLELARRYLSGVGKHNDRNARTASKAIVLVAPFPNLRRIPTDDAGDGVIHLLSELINTLREQARFKPDELAIAENDKIFSRFMISPMRTEKGNDLAVKYPIASGALGGFGGFLDHSFRRHDYLLGRRNAQAFLRWYLALPETNELFNEFQGNRGKWYVHDAGAATGSVEAGADATYPLRKFANVVGGPNDTLGLPIIPLVDRLMKPIKIGPGDLPNRDAISRDALARSIRTRVSKVVSTLVDVDLLSETEQMWTGSLLRLGARNFGTEVFSKKATAIIEQALNDVKGAFAP